jgi:hypothetical protein
MLKPEIIDAISEELKNQPADIKADIIGVELMQRGLKEDEIIFKPKSTLKRSYRRDVLDIDTTDVENRNKNYLVIEISREGIYDALPEGILHLPMKNKPFKSKDEILEEMKLYQRQEKAARKFFLPIDNEFIHHRMHVELAERKAFLGFDDDASFLIFSKFWGLTPQLSRRQKDFLLRLFPLIHKLRADYRMIESVLKILLGFEVKINLTRGEWITLDKNGFDLGSGSLGVDTITGNKFWIDTQIIHVTIKNVPNSEMSSFILNGKNKLLLDFMYRFLFPAHLSVTTNMEPQKKHFSLAQNEEAILGVNSIL